MSKKITDSKGRWRNKTIAFRMSPEEADNLDLRVKLSGINKQDYLVKSALEPTFTVQATTRMRANVRREMGAIASELRRLRQGSVIDDELAEKLEIIAQFAGSFADEESPVNQEDKLIKNINKDGSLSLENGATVSKNRPQEVN